MATTTNYSWSTPDDTALVKDGAAAIRTLGSSIDTTTKALNPSTTLGDIEYRSSTANTNTRLGIGSTGQVLTVAGGVPSWATVSAGGMTLINSGGTTLTGASVTIGSIPGTYKNLQLVVQNFLPSVDDNAICLRFNSDSNTRYGYSTTNPDTNVSFGEDQIAFGPSQDSATSQSLIVMDIFDYANAVTWKTAKSISFTNNATTSTNFNYSERYGIYNQTGAITSILLRPASGNFTSGTAYLYGVS
jgi:hypothetical protein